MARLKEKIAYALGDAAAGGIVWKVMSIAFPLFFTNVFGLSFADAAVLMLVARMFDVVTDPLMGTLADRTQSRFGTYRPWLIYGAIPFGLIFALLLYTPDFGPVGKRIYAYALYLLMMAVYTMVNVPYGSLLGVMTEDDDEKNQFSSFRMVGAYAMGFVTLLSFPYLQKMVGGSAAHQYAVIGAVLGIIAAVMTLACGLLTKERLKPKRAEKFSFQQFADLVHNKAWLYMTAIAVCTNFFNGFRYAVAGYMFDYCLHGNVTIEGLIINYTCCTGILRETIDGKADGVSLLLGIERITLIVNTPVDAAIFPVEEIIAHIILGTGGSLKILRLLQDTIGCRKRPEDTGIHHCSLLGYRMYLVVTVYTSVKATIFFIFHFR
jgi:glycoside/pentoside/hexuronide:cation symporter, GPH family